LVLGSISKIEPLTMKYSIPCLMKSLRLTTNGKIRAFIVEQIVNFNGTPAAPYILNFLKSDVETPPKIDLDLTLTQGLVSAIFVSIVQTHPTEIEPLLNIIQKELSFAEGNFKMVIISILGTLSQRTELVIPILQKELDSEINDEMHNYIEKTLDFAKKNAN